MSRRLKKMRATFSPRHPLRQPVVRRQAFQIRYCRCCGTARHPRCPMIPKFARIQYCRCPTRLQRQLPLSPLPQQLRLHFQPTAGQSRAALDVLGHKQLLQPIHSPQQAGARATRREHQHCSHSSTTHLLCLLERRCVPQLGHDAHGRRAMRSVLLQGSAHQHRPSGCILLLQQPLLQLQLLQQPLLQELCSPKAQRHPIMHLFVVCEEVQWGALLVMVSPEIAALGRVSKLLRRQARQSELPGHRP